MTLTIFVPDEYTIPFPDIDLEADRLVLLKGISILASYGFNGQNPGISGEALRCLANTLTLKPEARKNLADTTFALQLAAKFNKVSASPKPATWEPLLNDFL